MHWSQMINKAIIFSVFCIPLFCDAADINIYDSKGDKEKAIVEVSCNEKLYQLVVNKKDLGYKLDYIGEWFDMIIKTKCNKGNK